MHPLEFYINNHLEKVCFQTYYFRLDSRYFSENLIIRQSFETR
jgi:hypothetical protein